MWMGYLLINTGTVPDLGVLFLHELIKITVNSEISVNGNNTATMERVS